MKATELISAAIELLNKGDHSGALRAIAQLPGEVGFNEREAGFLPDAAFAGIAEAMGRLIDGDLDGALTTACGVVNTRVNELYRNKALGDPAKDSFQTSVRRALEATGRLPELKRELVSSGWSENDARLLCDNFAGALNQFAYVMQSLRSKMSDVHGKKPALEAVVFDALKLSSVLVSLMK
jgi:hypothetical protein